MMRLDVTLTLRASWLEFPYWRQSTVCVFVPHSQVDVHEVVGQLVAGYRGIGYDVDDSVVQFATGCAFRTPPFNGRALP
jgi:hypothetical protein